MILILNENIYILAQQKDKQGHMLMFAVLYEFPDQLWFFKTLKSVHKLSSCKCFNKQHTHIHVI